MGNEVKNKQVMIDFYPEGGSLLIAFDKPDGEVLESDALVIVGFKDGKLSSIEILFDNKKVVEKLKSIFSNGDNYEKEGC